MPKDFETIAISQAEEMNKQAERIRELIRERDREKSNAEAAYDLAEQYARRLGVDIGRDDVLKYVEQYWDQRGGLEKRVNELETFRWDVFQIHRELKAASEDVLLATTCPDLVPRLIKRIEAINRSGPARKKGELFPRPEAPGLDSAA